MNSSFQPSASALSPLNFQLPMGSLGLEIDENPMAVALPRSISRIKTLVRLDRLKAAQEADELLRRETRYFRPSRKADLRERLPMALAVWAVTRARMGLHGKAESAIQRAINWVGDCPGSTCSAFVRQNWVEVSGHTGSSREQLEAELLKALLDHSLTRAGVDGEASVLIDLAKIYLRRGQFKLCRSALMAARGRLSVRSPRALDAGLMLILSYLQEKKLEKAESSAESLAWAQDESIDVGRRIELLSLLSKVHLTRGLSESSVEHGNRAVECQLRALRLSTDHAGNEILLNQLLLLVGSLTISDPLDHSARELVEPAIGKLVETAENDRAWVERVSLLQSGLLSQGGADTTRLDSHAFHRRLLRAQRCELANDKVFRSSRCEGQS